MGLAAIFSFSSSASCSLLAFARRFWNQIFTCVSVRLSELENSARSAIDRYCFCRNFRSSASSWDVVNGVRGFRLVLCFLRGQAGGLSRPKDDTNEGINKPGIPQCQLHVIMTTSGVELNQPYGFDLLSHVHSCVSLQEQTNTVRTNKEELVNTVKTW